VTRGAHEDDGVIEIDHRAVDERPARPTGSAEPRPAQSLTIFRLARSLAKAPEAARLIVKEVERIAVEADRALGWRDRIPPILGSFIAFVVLPAAAASVYFAFIASDQFTVETRFAVRSLDVDSSPSSLGAVAGVSGGGAGSGAGARGVSISASPQNSYVVTSYIRSRAIVDDLSAKVKLREIFQRPEADFWARLRDNAPVEKLVAYWNTMIDTDVEAVSGVVTLRIRAFRRDDALALGKAVVAASEDLVNRISDRARRDATAMAEKDVRRAFVAVQSALAELTKFREEFGMIDPGQKSSEITTLLAPLMGDKIRLENELFVASRELAPNAPTVRVLREQIETTDRQIKELQSKLTNRESRGGTIAESLTRFESLETQRMLAEQLYALARSDLDRAQLRANRQSIYLTVFVPPSLPEIALYPHRLTFPLLIFVGLAVIWSIAAMVLASIEDHRL
jgi:capsular polysaccharide transport system permease protein